MARSNFLRPLTATLLFGVVPAFAACNGHVISIGSTGDTLQAVSGGTPAVAKAVTEPAVSCPAGWEHPNFCCTAGPSSASSCGFWEENPFRACDKGATTYPNPLSCCSLSDPKKCTDKPSSGPVAPPPPPPAYGCGYACGPGWWPTAPGSPNGNGCCTVDPSGGVSCAGWAMATPSCAPNGPVTNGGGGSSSGGGPIEVDASAPPPDASVAIDAGGPPPIDAGCDAAPPYTGGPADLCGACPPGWTRDSVQPEVCCEVLSDGTRQCFSQATGSVSGSGGSSGSSGGTNGSGGSTPPSSGWGSGGGNPGDGGPTGPSCSGSDRSCQCNNTVNGHSYALACTADSTGKITCSCTVDGSSTGSTSVASCQDSSAVQNAFSLASGCGFP